MATTAKNSKPGPPARKTITTAKSGADQYTINSVDRALDILEALRDGGGAMNLSEIAAATGLHNATAFRFVTSLRRRGILVKNEDSGVYRLGYAIIALAEQAKSNGGLALEARPAMRRLRDSIQETVYLSVREGDTRLDIEQFDGMRDVRRVIALGASRPLYSGAPSMALLCGLEDREIDQLLRRVAPRGFDREDWKAQVRKASSLGFAESSTRKQACAVSAPIFSPAGEVVAVVTVSAPTTLFDELRKDMVAGVKKAAAEIMQALR